MPSDLGRALGRLLAAMIAVAVLALMWRVAEVDLARLWQGLPRLAVWSARGWPPDFEDGATLLRRAGETLAMATLGTLLGALVAAPLCLLAARTTAPGASRRGSPPPRSTSSSSMFAPRPCSASSAPAAWGRS